MDNFPQVQKILIGAGGIDLQKLKTLTLIFPRAQIWFAYGMTECASSITFLKLRESYAEVQEQYFIKNQPQISKMLPQNSFCVGSAIYGVSIQILPWINTEAELQDDLTCGFQNKTEIKSQTENKTQNLTESQIDQLIVSQIDPQMKFQSKSSMKPQMKYLPDSQNEPQIKSTINLQEEKSNSQRDRYICGEIYVKGPNVFEGYYKRPQTTSLVLDKQRWFKTGDLGYIDDNGLLWFCGRLKDVIRSGAESIQASEVEMVLNSSPFIKNSAVVGLQDDRLEQIVAALIQVSDDIDVGDKNRLEEQVRMHCLDAGLSRFKLPRFIVFQRNHLPTNATGKLQKGLIKQLLEYQKHDFQSKI